MLVTNTIKNTSQPSKSSDHLPTLDGWRAVAIVLVILFHGTFGDNSSWAQKLSFGHLGVDIFFGLSGFLICSRLLRDREQEGKIDLRSFYIRRCFRILPAAQAYLITLGILTQFGILKASGLDLLSSMLFYRNYISDEGTWYTRHFWSLAVEEHFYLIFPVLLIFRGVKWNRRFLPVIAVIIAIWRGIDTRCRYYEMVFPASWTHFRTDVRLDSLFWGCWGALMVEHHGAWIKNWLNWSVAWILVIAVGCTALLPFPLVWRTVLIPWLLVSTVLLPKSSLAAFLELPLMRWVGRLSYSLYLWQQLLFIGQTEWVVPAFCSLQQWPWNVITLIVVAMVSYYLLERPMIRLGHFLTSRRIRVTKLTRSISGSAVS